MSEVTNLILSFSVLEDEISRVKEVNLFQNNGRGFNLVSADFEREFEYKKRSAWYGGSKYLETPLFIGAYNHLDLVGLVNHLKNVNWDEPENVQLIVKEQASEKFRIIELR